MDQINKPLAIGKTYDTLKGPGIEPIEGQEVAQVEKIISTIIGLLTMIAAIFFVLQIIFAGYSFLSAQGDEKKVESARKRLTDGILGLAIVVFAYGIGALISKLLGLDNIFDLSIFIK